MEIPADTFSTDTPVIVNLYDSTDGILHLRNHYHNDWPCVLHVAAVRGYSDFGNQLAAFCGCIARHRCIGCCHLIAAESMAPSRRCNGQ
jgi:hypothetical protein